jgi:hypothetical protein
VLFLLLPPPLLPPLLLQPGPTHMLTENGRMPSSMSSGTTQRPTFMQSLWRKQSTYLVSSPLHEVDMPQEWLGTTPLANRE